MAMVPLSLAPKTIKFLMFAFNLLFVVSIHGIPIVRFGATRWRRVLPRAMRWQRVLRFDSRAASRALSSLSLYWYDMWCTLRCKCTLVKTTSRSSIIHHFSCGERRSPRADTISSARNCWNWRESDRSQLIAAWVNKDGKSRKFHSIVSLGRLCRG